MGRVKFAKYSRRRFDALIAKNADTVYAVNDTGDFSNSSLDEDAELYIGDKLIKTGGDVLPPPVATECHVEKLERNITVPAGGRPAVVLSFQVPSSGTYMVSTHATVVGDMVNFALFKIASSAEVISSTTQYGVNGTAYNSVTLTGVITVSEADVAANAKIELHVSVPSGNKNATVYSVNQDGAVNATRMDIVKITPVDNSWIERALAAI